MVIWNVLQTGYLMTIWSILCSFGTFCSGFGIMHQEKSGNPANATLQNDHRNDLCIRIAGSNTAAGSGLINMSLLLQSASTYLRNLLNMEPLLLCICVYLQSVYLPTNVHG
jgi:hypothetical protein